MSIANLPPLSGTIVVDSGVFDVSVELASGADLIFKSPSGLAETTMQQLNNTQFLAINHGDGSAVASEIIFQAKNSAGVLSQIVTANGDSVQLGGSLFINTAQVAGEYAYINAGSGITEIISDTRYAVVPQVSALNLYVTDAVQAIVPVFQGTPTLVTIDPQLNCSNGLSVLGNMSCTGTLSSGDVPVMAGWAFSAVPSSTLTTIYTSPDLPIGVYLVTAAVNVALGGASTAWFDAINIYFIDETNHQTPAKMSSYNQGTSTWGITPVTNYCTAVTTFLNVTSATNNFFSIEINCKTSDNTNYELLAQGTGLGDGGVKYMKIA